MKKFYVTFGQNHPFRDGWIEIEVLSSVTEESIRKYIFEKFGDKWAFLYTEETFKPEYFPNGCIGKGIYAR